MIKTSREDRIHLEALAATASCFDPNDMDIFSKDAFFSNLAKLQTLAEQGEQALSTIEGISQKSSKWYSLGWISEQMAKNGEVDRALQIAGKILDCSYQSDALSGIAKTIYFLDFERACSVAAIIENPETRWETFQTFCNWESSSGKYNSAAEIAHGIKFASYRARATLAAAHACKETGDINTLLNLVDTLWASVEEIEDHLSRTEILLGLSDLHKSKNDGVRAVKALRHAVSAASMIEDPETCLDALLRCGIAQVSLGDIDGAARTADDISFASEYVDWSLSGTADELRRQRIRFSVNMGEPLDGIKVLYFSEEDPGSKTSNIASAIQILAEAGRSGDGESLLAELIGGIEEIESSSVGMYSYEVILAALACGCVGEAICAAEKFEELSGSIDDPISGICSIVEFMSETGNQTGANEYLASTIDKILRLPVSDRVWPYECVARTQRAIGDEPGALETLHILTELHCDDEGANQSSVVAASEVETRMTSALSAQDWTSANTLLATVSNIPDRIRLLVTIFSEKGS